MRYEVCILWFDAGCSTIRLQGVRIELFGESREALILEWQAGESVRCAFLRLDAGDGRSQLCICGSGALLTKAVDMRSELVEWLALEVAQTARAVTLHFAVVAVA